ncbi:MAG: tRNA lysidine(34) synthetase TilS [Victivallales bacterium]|nr:tRNA lysidine(34) synthetase TilS [Victivallales bacterium]
MMNRLSINSLSIYSYEFEKIYVGFSGGADSTALLLLLQAASVNSSLNQFKFEAVHFEHGLRGEESRNDAKWCREFCKNRSIPFRMFELGMDPRGNNIEAEARRKRVEFWKNTVEPGTEAVALGHHADDNIENLFLRLLRGSNSSGLTALRAERVIDGVTYLRPLLGFYRAEIEEFLKGHGVSDWREDSTNAELVRTRAIIRNAVLPEIRRHFPESRKALLKSLDALRKDAEFMEAEAERYFKEKIKGRRRVEVAKFADIPQALMFRVLRLWLSSLIGRDFTPDSNLAERFEAEITRHHPESAAGSEKKSIPVFGSSALVVQKGFVCFDKDMETVAIKINMLVWEWRTNPAVEFTGHSFKAFVVDSIERGFFDDRSHMTVCFNADAFPDRLIIRAREPGDAMVPFKGAGTVTVKKLLEGSSLDSDTRRQLPVVTAPDGEIIWVPGIRRSNFANIPDNGENDMANGNFLVIKCRRLDDLTQDGGQRIGDS